MLSYASLDTLVNSPSGGSKLDRASGGRVRRMPLAGVRLAPLTSPTTKKKLDVEGLICSSMIKQKFARAFGFDSSKQNKGVQTSADQAHALQTSKPRVSNITFSTVTSATGLPTIAAEPNRPRSSRWELAAAASSSRFSSTHDAFI
ncbi:unnamed protein product, partial [Caenorhabditis auriculariae]